MTSIRPFVPEDYPAYVAIENAVYPDYPETVEETRYSDEHRDPKCKWRRWVAEQDGRVVGQGGYSQSAGMYHPRKFNISVSVLPEHRGRGTGKALYEHVLAALAPLDPLSVRTDTREDMARGVRFLQDRGFVEVMREWESRLDVAAFDFAPYEGAQERIQHEGVAIQTLEELSSDPNRDRKLYELDWEVSKDVPHPEPVTKIDFAHFERTTLQNPDLLPGAYFVAVAPGGEYAGVSVLWNSQASDELYTGLTGVTRPWRRKGIALALKLRAIEYAKARGCPQIKTWNEQNNRGMLGINERLGFVKQPAWISFHKALQTEEKI